MSDVHTKTKWFSAHIQQPSKFGPPTQKPSQSISTLKTGRFRSAQKKKVNRESRSKTNSISTNTWKPNDYRPEHNKINFDSLHKKVNVDTHTKSCQFRSPPHQKSSQFRPYHWNQVNFDPYSISSRFRYRDNTTMLISIHTLKTSHFGPSHKNQVNFDPYIEINSKTTHTTTIFFFVPTLKSSQVPSPRLKSS